MLRVLRLAFLLSLSCFSSLSFPAEVLTIGASLSLTGKYAELGSMSEKAYRLWEADVNRRGGVMGRQVALSIRDDQSDPRIGAELYRKLIVDDKVDFVLGPYSSEITDAVAEVTEHYRHPLLASGGSADSMWEKGRKYLFGVYVTSSKYPVGFLEMVVKAGMKDIAIVGGDDAFSKSIEAGTREWAQRYQLKIVAYEQFRKGTPDLEKYVQAARSSNADALMVAGHFDDAVKVSQALKKLGWKPKAYYATVGPAVQKYYDVLKDDADLTFSSSQWEPGLPFPGVREFARSFNDTYHLAPSYQAASAYASGQILEAAIKKSKSLDRSKVRDTLATLDAITVIGRYGVDLDGRQVRHFTTTVQWQGGRKVIVAPQELATAKPVWR